MKCHPGHLAEKRKITGQYWVTSNTIGPMVAPLLFATAMSAFGWRGAFLAISVPGLLLAVAADWYPRDHPAEHPNYEVRHLLGVQRIRWRH